MSCPWLSELTETACFCFPRQDRNKKKSHEAKLNKFRDGKNGEMRKAKKTRVIHVKGGKAQLEV